MKLFAKDDLDPTLGFQLVHCGRGRVWICIFGSLSGSYNVGEVALKQIARELNRLSDDHAQQIVRHYCENAARIHALLIMRRSRSADLRWKRGRKRSKKTLVV